MFFRNSTNHDRGLKFQEWQQTTDAALRRPGVQQQLGRLGARLVELNATAFLPNVRHSEVRVPRRYQNTNRMGILPYLESDNNLRPHNTLLQPTPARKARIKQALSQAGMGDSRGALNDFIQRALAQITGEEKTALVNPRRNVSGGALSHYDTDTGILVTSRPLIVPKWQGLPLNRILRGAIGAHEPVHAVDAEELMTKPDLFYRARTELRGYRVGAIIAKDGIASGELTRWRYEEDDNFTVEIEGVRKMCGIDSDALLNDGLQLHENEAPLYMVAMGLIEL